MKKTVLAAAVLIVFACFLVSPIVCAQSSTDWPMYRHDLHHTGSDTDTFDTTPNSILWTLKKDGSVTQPTAVGSKVYFGSYDNSFYCVNSANGNQIWKYTTGGPNGAEPAVSGGVVYFGSNDLNLYALNTDNGQKIWSKNIGWIAGAPAVVGNRVYVGADNIVYCLNSQDGNEIWHYETIKSSGTPPVNYAVYASPSVYEGKVYAVAQDSYLYCLNAADGALLWKFKTGDLSESSPAIADGKVFFGSNDGNLYCLDASNGNTNWQYHTGNRVNSSPAIEDGKIVFGSADNKVYCLNMVNGQQIWTYTTGGEVYSSPAVSSGLVYVGSFDGALYVLDLNTGALVWNYQTSNEVWSSPSINNGLVYFGSGNNLYAAGKQYISGVKAGDWFRYKVTTSGNISSEGALPDQLTLNIDSVDTTGKLVICHLNAHYADGKETTLPSYQINLETGPVNPSQTRTQPVGDLPVLASNLRQGDLIYESGSNGVTINETLALNATTAQQQYQLLTVASDSMKPTLNWGDRILVDTAVDTANLNSHYPNSDIIVFKDTKNSQTGLIVFRIVAKEVVNGEVYYQVKGDANGAVKYPGPVTSADYWIKSVPASDVVGKVAMVFQDTGYRPTSALNRISTTQNVSGGMLLQNSYFEQKTGVLFGLSQLYSANNPEGSYSIVLMMAESSTQTTSFLPPLSQDNNLNPKVYSLVSTPLTTPQKAVEVAAWSTGVVAFAFAGSFAASRLAESVGGGINGWVLPKPLQDFAKKYGAKVFEQKFSPKARNKKPSLITRREILVLAVSVLFTGFVMSFVGVNGYSNILDISKFTVAFGLALVSAFIIQAVSLLSDALCSYKAKPQKELKLWNLGTVMWFLSGIVAKVPFSSPSVSKSIGDAKYKVKQQKKIASLNVVVKVLAVLSLLLLFASLNAFGVLPEVGNYGLVTVMISFTAMVTPIAPLSGKDIYRYKKKTSLALVAFSILLLFLQFENTLTFWSYTIIGLAALALLPWAVWRLWSEKTRINQSYVSLWFEH